MNLDPACYEVPYPANIDIRDTVNYKEVMKQYGLGPNGGIVTSLNLFATKFDQVGNLNFLWKLFILNTLSVVIWDKSGFQMVNLHPVIKWSGFRMVSENWTTVLWFWMVEPFQNLTKISWVFRVIQNLAVWYSDGYCTLRIQITRLVEYSNVWNQFISWMVTYLDVI